MPVETGANPGLLQKLLAMLAPSTQQIAQQNPMPQTGASPGMMQRMMAPPTPPMMNTGMPMPTPGTPEYQEYIQKNPLGAQGPKRGFLGGILK